MVKRLLWSLTLMGAVAALGWVLEQALYAQDTGKPPDWKHGLSLPVRKAGEIDITDKTQRLGVEAFVDKQMNQLVYIEEAGYLAVGASAGVKDSTEVKAPPRLYALEARVRKVGKTAWDDAFKYGCEIYKDDNAGTLLYISDVGSIAIAP